MVIWLTKNSPVLLENMIGPYKTFQVHGKQVHGKPSVTAWM